MPPKEKEEADGDVMMLDMVDVDVVVEPPPPPPPPQCVGCKEGRTATMSCLHCADAPPSIPGIIDLTDDNAGVPKVMCFKVLQRQPSAEPAARAACD